VRIDLLWSNPAGRVVGLRTSGRYATKYEKRG
jgi:hypothetical protein